MDLLEALRGRRSVRKYTREKISDEKLKKILQAGLISASSRSVRPWEFIVVRDKDALKFLSECRDGGHAKMLGEADSAIIVIADPEKTDTWIEHCSIAMSNMHLMADTLGVGSCWIQGRLRRIGDLGTEEYLRRKLRFPEDFKLAAILSLGRPAVSLKPHSLEELPWEKVHRETFY